MDLGLEGRRALVGGGGSGIGGGIAAVLAAEGARVALIGRTATASRTRRRRSAGSRSWPISRPRTARPPRSRRPSPASAASTCWSSTPAARRAARSTRSTRRRGTSRSTAPCGRCCDCSAPRCRTCGRIRPVGADRPVVVGPGADPALTTSNVLRPGLAGLDEVAPGRDRAGPDQRAGAGPDRDGPDRLPRQPARRGRRDHRRGGRAPA